MLVINFIFVDKPFKFWNKKEAITVEEEEEKVETDVTSNFDVDPTNIDEIRNAILDLKHNIVKREQLKRGALYKARELTIENRAKAIIQFLQEV